MQKAFYFLSPVEVVKVSSQNLDEVAEWCGGKVAQTESRRVPGRMDSYVWVPTPKGSNISWAFPGMFITKRLVVTIKGELRATWAVFRRDYFEKNYFETPNDAVDKTWELEDRRPKVKKDQAQPTEPVSQPAVSTEEAEQMDEETRERIEQVNREILSGVVLPPSSTLEAAVAIVKEELGGEVIAVEPTGQAIVNTPAQDRLEAREDAVEQVVAEKRS